MLRVSERIWTVIIHDCGLQRLQLFVYRASSGIQAIMKNNQRKLAEKDESVLMASGIPYTIVRAGMLQKTPGGTQGFNFEEVHHFSLLNRPSNATYSKVIHLSLIAVN